MFFLLGNVMLHMQKSMKTWVPTHLCTGYKDSLLNKIRMSWHIALCRKYTDESAWVYQAAEDLGSSYYTGKVRHKSIFLSVFVFSCLKER